MRLLDYVHTGGVAAITLRNPPENRLTPELMGALADVVTDITARSDTRAVLFRADGPDYCFGGDFTKWVGITDREAIAGRMRGLAIANMYENIPVPIVTAVQGQCRGGGFELALRADIIIAADNAQFSHPEATIGIFTLLGGVQRVAERVGRTRAMQWALTSEVINAPEALAASLINEVVPVADLQARAQAVADQLAAGPTHAHADHKALLRAWSDRGVAAADALMPEMAGRTFVTEDAQGSIRAATEDQQAGRPRRKYDFKGR